MGVVFYLVSWPFCSQYSLAWSTLGATGNLNDSVFNCPTGIGSSTYWTLLQKGNRLDWLEPRLSTGLADVLELTKDLLQGSAHFQRWYILKVWGRRFLLYNHQSFRGDHKQPPPSISICSHYLLCFLSCSLDSVQLCQESWTYFLNLPSFSELVNQKDIRSTTPHDIVSLKVFVLAPI